MQAGMKRKHPSDTGSSDGGSSSSDDETWTPGSSVSSSSEGAESPALSMDPVTSETTTTTTAIHTRSRGPVERPTAQADIAMECADAVVDNESDLSSDTEEDDDEEDGEEEEESCEEEEEEEEESDEEDDYSDDDSFVTSNEDADRDERDEILTSYRKVFGEDGEDADNEEGGGVGPDLQDGQFIQIQVPEVDFSVGGYVAGTETDL
jgi:hypothetical protein